ncbi:hypothetical protein LZ30DRAFT_394276 [Colletotrichum cereale]|nr:hypothetical protein LZ30DRAFT_394276 [Colletotrichum cereale]
MMFPGIGLRAPQSRQLGHYLDAKYGRVMGICWRDFEMKRSPRLESSPHWTTSPMDWSSDGARSRYPYLPENQEVWSSRNTRVGGRHDVLGALHVNTRRTSRDAVARALGTSGVGACSSLLVLPKGAARTLPWGDELTCFLVESQKKTKWNKTISARRLLSFLSCFDMQLISRPL